MTKAVDDLRRAHLLKADAGPAGAGAPLPRRQVVGGGGAGAAGAGRALRRGAPRSTGRVWFTRSGSGKAGGNGQGESKAGGNGERQDGRHRNPNSQR